MKKNEKEEKTTSEKWLRDRWVKAESLNLNEDIHVQQIWEHRNCAYRDRTRKYAGGDRGGGFRRKKDNGDAITTSLQVLDSWKKERERNTGAWTEKVEFYKA